MTSEIGHVTGTRDQAEPDGSHMIEVSHGDCVIEVRIDPEQVAILLNRLQLTAMAHAQATAQNMTFPELTATRIALAHRGREVAMMVSTAQIGSLVVRLSDPLFETLRSEVDRMKTYRSAPPRPQ